MLEPPPFPSVPPGTQPAPPSSPKLSRLASSLASDIRPYQAPPPSPLDSRGAVRGPPLSIRSLSSPFVDRRKEIKAYFAIHCPNLAGTSVTKFASGVSGFSNSQSWGWKSSSLRSEEYLGPGAAQLAEESVGMETSPLTRNAVAPSSHSLASAKYHSLRSVTFSPSLVWSCLENSDFDLSIPDVPSSLV
jgi:hypothetical protein